MITGIMQSTIPQLLASFGIVLPSTSRAFLPAFLAALYLRLLDAFGDGTQFEAVVDVAEAEAPWFCSIPMVVILGLLAGTEMFISKSKELEELLRQSDPLVKPALAMLTTFGILDATDAEIVGAVGEGLTVTEASILPWKLCLSLLSGGLVFATVWLRSEMLELLDEMELDGLSRFVSWMEEFWVVLLMALFAFLPIVLLLVSAAFLAMLSIAERLLAARAEATRTPCESCAKPRFPHGRYCASCSAANAAPKAVGLFGLPSAKPAIDMQTHPVELLSKGRCSSCAASLPRGRTGQACEDCGYVAFGAEDEIQRFVEHIGARERRILLICFGLGLIPVVGVIPAVILYRLRLVAPFRRYLPRWQSVGLRWIARLASFLLLLLQFMPPAHLLSLPLMAWVNHRLYRTAFRKAARAAAKTAAKPVDAKRRVFTLPPLLRTLGAKVRSRGVRPALVGGFVVVALLGAGVTFWTVTASATPSCLTDRDRLEGSWLEDRTWFGLLDENFLADGSYFLNGVEGRWSYTAPGRLRLEAGPSAHEYEAWITEDRLYYVADDHTPSVYLRQSSVPDTPGGCPGIGQQVTGVWYGDGETLRIEADGLLSREGQAGRWTVTGNTLSLQGAGLGENARAAINDAERLLIIAEGTPHIFQRTPPTGASVPAVASGTLVHPSPNPAETSVDVVGQPPGVSEADVLAFETEVRASIAAVQEGSETPEQVSFLERAVGVVITQPRQVAEERCEAGETEACMNAGLYYSSGIGVRRDDQRALVLFRTACDGGYGLGCGSLGAMYLQGAGVPLDRRRGWELLRQACRLSEESYCNDLESACHGGEQVACEVEAQPAAPAPAGNEASSTSPALSAMGLTGFTWGQLPEQAPVTMETESLEGCLASILELRKFQSAPGAVLVGDVALSYHLEHGLFEVVVRTDSSVSDVVAALRPQLGLPENTGRAQRWDIGDAGHITAVVSRGRTAVRAWHQRRQSDVRDARRSTCDQ